MSRKIVDVVRGRGLTTKEITKELGKGSNISLIVNLMCDIRKYLASFAPAFEKDIAWWTGFPKGEVRKILQELKSNITRMEVPDSDGTYMMLCSDKEQMEAAGLPKKKNVNLLPVLDPYIMSYGERKR